MLQPEQYHEL